MEHKKNPSILLVEDDDNDAELTITSLREFNLLNKIDRVVDGQDALDFLLFKNKYANREKHQPALVMLDLKLPKIGGMEVLTEMRNNEDLKYIPVVVLTSSHEDSDLRNCYKIGANAYVVKPVDFTQFARAVKEIGIFWTFLNEPPPENNAK